MQKEIVAPSGGGDAGGHSAGAVGVGGAHGGQAQLSSAGASGASLLGGMNQPPASPTAGQRNGKLPLIQLDNGITYDGEWLNDKPHGRGIRLCLFGRLVRRACRGRVVAAAGYTGGWAYVRALLDVCVNGCVARAR